MGTPGPETGGGDRQGESQDGGNGPGTQSGERAVVDSLEQIGSKWRLIVLGDLRGGEKRFNELKDSTGASSRTLSRVLDDLQETGLVDRRIEEDAPVATYYSLTPKGESLGPVFEAIEEWAAEWMDVPESGN